MRTVAGNVCNVSPAAEGVPALLALDAEVELRSHAGARVLALEDFLLGNRKTACAWDELVSAVIVPKRAEADGSILGAAVLRARALGRGRHRHHVDALLRVHLGNRALRVIARPQGNPPLKLKTGACGRLEVYPNKAIARSSPGAAG